MTIDMSAGVPAPHFIDIKLLHDTFGQMICQRLNQMKFLLCNRRFHKFVNFLVIHRFVKGIFAGAATEWIGDSNIHLKASAQLFFKILDTVVAIKNQIFNGENSHSAEIYFRLYKLQMASPLPLKIRRQLWGIAALRDGCSEEHRDEHR